MPDFIPQLTTLPPPQRALLNELGATPSSFTLYGGTALALRLGHRTSVDFDFFSHEAFDPDRLARTTSYLRHAERVQVEENTLTCRVDRGGPVLVSFFGGLPIGEVAERDVVHGMSLHVASLLDVAGAKAAVVQKRAEAKDYIDIDAILKSGVDLSMVLASGVVLYGPAFNPVLTLKALSYFDDVPSVLSAVCARLRAAVRDVDITRLPVLTPYRLAFRAP